MINVETEGLAKLVNQLEKFSPDVSKELKSRLRDAANQVAKGARSLIPDDALSNWGQWTSSRDGRDLGFIGAWAKTGIKPAANRYRRAGVTVGFGYSVVSNTPGGNLYEVVGKGTRQSVGSGERGFTFVGNLNNKRNGPERLPRTLYPAYYNVMPKVQDQIESAVRDAERKVGR